MRTRLLSRAAVVLTLVSIAAAVGMQWVTGEWFPPENSISQYANSEAAWLLTTCLATLGLAVACLSWLTTHHPREELPAILLGMSAFGLLLSAAVPATAGGHDPQNLQSNIHQVGGILGMLCLAIAAILLATPRTKTWAGRACLLTAAVTLAALILMAAAVYDVEPTGLGRQRAWALYQSIAATCEAVFVLALAALLRQFPGRTR